MLKWKFARVGYASGYCREYPNLRDTLRKKLKCDVTEQGWSSVLSSLKKNTLGLSILVYQPVLEVSCCRGGP
jgi:hypothetical protein